MERYCHKFANVIACNELSYSCCIAMALERPRHICECYSNITVNEDSSCGRPVVSCGRTFRTDRREKANGRFSKFCESAYINQPHNALNAQLNPICHLPALLGAHHILHVRGLRVNNIQRINHLYVSQKCAMWAELL